MTATCLNPGGYDMTSSFFFDLCANQMQIELHLQNSLNYHITSSNIIVIHKPLRFEFEPHFFIKISHNYFQTCKISYVITTQRLLRLVRPLPRSAFQNGFRCCMSGNDCLNPSVPIHPREEYMHE